MLWNRIFLKFFFSNYKSMQAIDPHVHDKSSPRGLIGRIYLGNHLLFIKPHGFRDIFYVFPIICLWELLINRVWPVWIPGT